MTDHPDYQAMLAAVLADRADDLPRLVLADWLQENAKEVDCARCKGSGSHLAPDASERHGTRFVRRAGILADCGPCSGSGRVPNGFAERAEFIRTSIYVGSEAENGWTMQPHIHHPVKHLFRLPGLQDSQYLYRRGLVDEIRCQLRQWVGERCERCGGHGSLPGIDEGNCDICHGIGTVGGIGPELVRRCPLTKVTLTDREPHESVFENQPDSCRWMWVWNDRALDNPSSLPWSLYSKLRIQSARDGGHDWAGYPTRQAALDALIDACLAWARGGDAGRFP